MVKSSSSSPGNPFEALLHLLTAPIPPTLTARHHQPVDKGLQVIVDDVNFDLSASQLLFQVPANNLLYEKYHSICMQFMCVERGTETGREKERERESLPHLDRALC